MRLMYSFFNPVGEAGGIDIANGKGKLGLLNRMWPIPFPPNQLLRFIVVGSVLSMTFIGVLFVYSLLRILVKPCSRFLGCIFRGNCLLAAQPRVLTPNTLVFQPYDICHHTGGFIDFGWILSKGKQLKYLYCCYLVLQSTSPGYPTFQMGYIRLQ